MIDEKGEVHIIRERETIHTLEQLESMPKHLSSFQL
jgi:hypothetical protein